MDLEADSLHRYRERLCLIQYADAHGVEIIDPLVIDDMGPFVQWLQGTQVWMHGADYDMQLLQRAYRTLPAMVLDTQVAARLLGFRQFGLAALVEHFYGIKLSKKNQKADWGKRPIREDMIDYAQGDVVYMLDMADRLVKMLRKKKRYEWFIESCQVNMTRARIRFTGGGDDVSEADAPWRLKGCGKLNRRGLAALRSLYEWRSQEAMEWDRPAFMVCSNAQLLQWSAQLQEFRTIKAPPKMFSDRTHRLYKAVDHFQLLDEEEYPALPVRKGKRKVESIANLVNAWSARRDAQAAKLGVDPSIIASRSQLEDIAHDEEAGLSRLMDWQRSLLTAAAPRRRKWWFL